MDINKNYKEYIKALMEAGHNMYFSKRCVGEIVWCIEVVESFIERNELKPKISETLKGKNRYSIVYDTKTNTIKTCVTCTEGVLPFFMFDSEEKAQKVIDNCKEFLLKIFTYFIFAGGKL